MTSYEIHTLVSKTFPGFPSLGVENFILFCKSCEEGKLYIITCILVSDYLEVVVMFYKLFFFKKISKSGK
jgi:hypothetical protein